MARGKPNSTTFWCILESRQTLLQVSREVEGLPIAVGSHNGNCVSHIVISSLSFLSLFSSSLSFFSFKSYISPFLMKSFPINRFSDIKNRACAKKLFSGSVLRKSSETLKVSVFKCTSSRKNLQWGLFVFCRKHNTPIKFSSLSAPTKIEELTAGSDEKTQRSPAGNRTQGLANSSRTL